MKALLIGLALIGAQAFACPNLTGTYSCTYENGSEQLQLSQQEMDGVTVYNFKNPQDANDPGGALPADNQTYRLEDTKDFRNGTIRAWCEGEIFKIQQTAEHYQEESHSGNLDLTVSMSLSNSDLLQVTNGTYETGSGTYPINESMTCTRLN